MQRSRNRGCCQRQHIHILFHLFDLFFMCHAKPLFLINDQQTEIFEMCIRDSYCSIDTLKSQVRKKEKSLHPDISLYQNVTTFHF